MDRRRSERLLHTIEALPVDRQQGAVPPDHVHLVVARHSYAIEKLVDLMKGAATRRLKADGLHPLIAYAAEDGTVPHVWGRGLRKVFLDDDDAVTARVGYVERNPLNEGKRVQRWSFTVAFAGKT